MLVVLDMWEQFADCYLDALDQIAQGEQSAEPRSRRGSQRTDWTRKKRTTDSVG